MGLMYAFPVSRDEEDFVIEKEGRLTLKTYGLPYIFWIYALCVSAVLFFMFLAIKGPIEKLVFLGDSTDALLGYSLLTFLALLPLTLFGFFFYEKRLWVLGKKIGMEYRVYGLKVFSEEFPLEHLEVEGFLNTPNVARMKNDEESLGFQNKGYFILWLKFANGKQIQLDRHSRKVDLEKLKELLSSGS
jgi:hypothetical protein